MGVVAEMADRVVVMNRGEKVEEGPVERVFAQPAEAYTQRLLAAVPRLGGYATTSSPRSVVADPVPIDRKTTVVDAQGLTKRFGGGGLLSRFGIGDQGVLAMDDVGFTLAAGETLAIVGESGSGKSTAGRAILRLIEVDRGEINIDGRDVRKLGPKGPQAGAAADADDLPGPVRVAQPPDQRRRHRGRAHDHPRDRPWAAS
jgi:peptide/nickel transport system ATP-binding protein